MIHRRDIDGLRGVAVAAVVACHAGVQSLSGGFIGVDIFFVISGYLITSQITENQNGFQIIDFYDRRAKRILPALYTMIIFVVAISIMIMPPRSLELLSWSAIAASLFVPNFFFKQTTGYFGPSANELPLLHTWSLGVEEQFYIIYPIIIIALIRFGQRERIVRYLGAIAAASLVLSVFQVGAAPRDAFYLLPSRAWELILGGIVALCGSNIAAGIGRRAMYIVPYAGVSLIIVPAVMYSDNTPFPGFYAVVPCLGAACILISGGRGGLIDKFLSFDPLRYVGLVSYSLYLWHWPALVLPRLLLNRSLSGYEAAAGVLAALTIATISYRLIEQPARRWRGFTARQRLYIAGVAPLPILMICLPITMTGGLPVRVSTDVIQADKSQDDRNPLRRLCLVRDGTADVPIKGCIAPETGDGLYDIVVWGDSHADHFMPGIAAAAERRGLAARQISKIGCPPLVGVSPANRKVSSFAAECAEFNRQALDAISEGIPPKLVVLAGRWESYHRSDASGLGWYLKDTEETSSHVNSESLLRDGLSATVRALVNLGASVLIMEQVPEFDVSPSACVARALMHGTPVSHCGRIDISEWKERTFIDREIIHEIKNQYNHVMSFDPTNRLCDEGMCLAAIGGVTYYQDDDHLSATGSRQLLRDIEFPTQKAEHFD